jgi:hypothetical protein
LSAFDRLVNYNCRTIVKANINSGKNKLKNKVMKKNKFSGKMIAALFLCATCCDFKSVAQELAIASDGNPGIMALAASEKSDFGFRQNYQRDREKVRNEALDKNEDIPIYLFDEVELGGMSTTYGGLSNGNGGSQDAFTAGGFIITESGGFLYNIKLKNADKKIKLMEGGFIQASEFFNSYSVSDGIGNTYNEYLDAVYLALGNRFVFRYGVLYAEDDLALNFLLVSSWTNDNKYYTYNADDLYKSIYLSNKLGVGFVFDFEKHHDYVNIHRPHALKVGAFFGNNLTGMGKDNNSISCTYYGLSIGFLY